jgi:catechol 2,3-dioxygenase-like lactoylglutathione lyase family enzyme
MKKIFILMIFAQCSLSLFGQEDDYSVTFDHVALSVENVDQSAQFYMETLNLQEITNRTQINGIRWFSLGEGKELHLISILKDNITINKAVHFAITVSDFDSFVKKLNSMKINYTDWPGTSKKVNIRADGIKQVFFQDPNGYWIEVNSVGQKTN